MVLTCLRCGSSLTADFAGESGVGKCPKCGESISFPDTTVEYKVLTQNMLCGRGGFDKDYERVEGILNSLALEGWRVVGCMTQSLGSFDLAGFRPSSVLILERPVKRSPQADTPGDGLRGTRAAPTA